MEAFYEHGQPLHIAKPSDSIIKTFTYEAWKALTPAQMQQEQRKKNIIVSGWPLKEPISFDEHGLRKVAGTQMRQISINGDLNVVNSCHDHPLNLVSQTIPSNPPTTLVVQQLSVVVSAICGTIAIHPRKS